MLPDTPQRAPNHRVNRPEVQSKVIVPSTSPLVVRHTRTFNRYLTIANDNWILLREDLFSRTANRQIQTSIGIDVWDF